MEDNLKINRAIFIVIGIFLISLLLPLGHSFNFTNTIDELSKAGTSIFEHFIGIKDNILNVGSSFLGGKTQTKKQVILNISKTQNNVGITFKTPVELKMDYKKNSTIKLNPIIMDINAGNKLMFGNFTGLVVVNSDFKYKGHCNFILMNQNKIYLEKQENKINIEGQKQVRDNIFINCAKIKNIDFQNITGNLFIIGENKMNIELNEKPMHLENFEGNIIITTANIILEGNITYAKSQDFIVE